MQMTAALIGPAHGLRGEAILDVRTDDADLLRIGAILDTDSRTHPRLTIANLRTHKDRVLVVFDEVHDRETIETLRGTALLVDEHEEVDAWYPHQLKGLRAQDPDGNTLGTVTGLHVGAAQDLLLVKAPSGTVMVPFVTQLVPTVNVDGGYVVIDAPGGLFDDDVIDGADGGRS
ncbi:ribosome maturation factor RimM [Schaalia suimastitidis]|uniref:ribosome maturation factor RimM n=1 Tax=Schaalia suimastitidis TaxID=121163 RepID=UPI0004012B64|nr:ribosome maturation factor RimM [Schaalia suimastitidis]